MPGKFTWDEVKRHGTRKDAWIVVHGKVYNVTHFLNDHPGGWEIMEPYFGKDATVAFDEVNHSQEAMDMLKERLVGDIDANSKL